MKKIMRVKPKNKKDKKVAKAAELALNYLMQKTILHALNNPNPKPSWWGTSPVIAAGPENKGIKPGHLYFVDENKFSIKPIKLTGIEETEEGKEKRRRELMNDLVEIIDIWGNSGDIKDFLVLKLFHYIDKREG